MGLLIIALFFAISTAFYYISTVYAITNQRVILKIGFIRRDTLEILLHRVESIQLNQSILGRLFNYGSVTISDTGGSQDPMRHIPNPVNFRNRAQEQIEALGTSKNA